MTKEKISVNDEMYVTPDMLTEMYNNSLDECGELFGICGSRILSECDPIAYRCGESDYADSLCQDGYCVEDYNDDEYEVTE